MAKHHGVLLDEASYMLGDLDLSLLISQIKHWDRYLETNAEQRYMRLKDATIVVVNKICLDAELLCKLPSLKLILLTATGTDNVDLESCRKLGITVCNVQNYGTASVAQHVMSLILALSTNLIAYADETVSGRWSKASQFSTLSYPITELDGKLLGLVGYGTLAKGVEKLAQAFGMKILIAARTGSKPIAGRIALKAMLPQVDVLSLHCPLLPNTHHLIDMHALQSMKPSSLLINTSRGAVVDNVALAKALQEGLIHGAGIDVLEHEPPPLDHPLLQADVPNLIVTPHVAWASIEARQRLMDKVADNLAAWLAGKALNVVV